MGNHVACKNYTQKVPRAFINFTSTHFSLIAKNCVAIGTWSLLLRSIMMKCLENNFRVFVKHIKTSENGIADALSRRDWKRFKRLTKDMKIDEVATELPNELYPLSKIWSNY